MKRHVTVNKSATHGKGCYDTLRLRIVLRTEKHATHERDFAEKMPLNEV